MEIIDDAGAASGPTTCFYHHDRETGRRCTRCGRPACPDCLHSASVGSHCWECIKAAAPPRKEQIRRAVRGEDLLVTKILIAINVAVFIPTVLSGGIGGRSSSSFHVDWALNGKLVAAGEWYRLLTSGFLHFGIIHLGLNMYILYQLGLTLERGGAGRMRYIAIYFASLFAGSFLALILSPDGLTAGASGAVYGVAGAATIGLARRGVPFASTGWGPMLIINLLFTFSASGISVGGHVGGLIGGLVTGYLLLDPRLGQRPRTGFIVAVAIVVFSIGASVGAMQSRYGSCETAGQGLNTRIACERNN